jgi:hypothetical protein
MIDTKFLIHLYQIFRIPLIQHEKFPYKNEFESVHEVLKLKQLNWNSSIYILKKCILIIKYTASLLIYSVWPYEGGVLLLFLMFSPDAIFISYTEKCIFNTVHYQTKCILL